MALGTDLLGELHDYQSKELLIRAEMLSPIEVLHSATLLGAEVLRMEGQLGVAAPGAFADLIGVNGNPLENLILLRDQGRHIALIVKDGTLVKDAVS